MTILPAVLVAVALQRAAELILAAHNTRKLRALGAIELDQEGYPWLVLLHAGWLAALALSIPPDAVPSWPLFAAFALLQLGRIWVIASLGPRWTTRIIVVPDVLLVRSGPYRFCRHPNYLIVALEVALLPLAFGAVDIALLFTAANLALLARRIAIEDCGLALHSKG